MSHDPLEFASAIQLLHRFVAEVSAILQPVAT